MKQYRRSIWYRAGRGLALINIGWMAAGSYFVLVVNGNERPWPLLHIWIFSAIQLVVLLSSVIGWLRYQASKPEPLEGQVADTDPGVS
ncbi:hypothetical protein AAH991_26565 [Microbispora sp. ZYX-F-249]|uniref:Uncharacterized protein n=1 Tax=Microbispora maris TaxID=3144104 RepID=A0ABV0ATU2_9ACTN